jgi:hypothetical protein
LRDHYEYKDAMLTNSLFSDYLQENGMKVWKEESTRDIICLEFCNANNMPRMSVSANATTTAVL